MGRILGWHYVGVCWWGVRGVGGRCHGGGGGVEERMIVFVVRGGRC